MVKLPQTCSNLSAKIYLLLIILLVVNGFGNLNLSSLLVANEFDIEKKISGYLYGYRLTHLFLMIHVLDFNHKIAFKKN